MDPATPKRCLGNSLITFRQLGHQKLATLIDALLQIIESLRRSIGEVSQAAAFFPTAEIYSCFRAQFRQCLPHVDEACTSGRKENFALPGFSVCSHFIVGSLKECIFCPFEHRPHVCWYCSFIIDWFHSTIPICGS